MRNPYPSQPGKLPFNLFPHSPEFIEAYPYGEAMVARAVADGSWDAGWGERNGMAERFARSFVEEARRDRKSIRDVAKKYGLVADESLRAAA